ncbi:MAG TPA: hypothetical protein VN182_00550, partial [Flavobacterium sp.]|nr:hypothetical protein [Flavobacterium sp.]
VFENLNAGCVTKISVDNGSGKYETVWNKKEFWNPPIYKMTLSTDRSYYFKRKRRKVHEAPSVFNPGIVYAILDQAVANVVALKVEFNFGLKPGQKQIDAIGISDSEVPIEAKINTKPVFEGLSKPETIDFGELRASDPVVSFDGQKLFFTEETYEKELVFSCSKNANGEWVHPVEESPALNQNENYNFILAHQPGFILKGGNSFKQGTGESGFEFLDSNSQPIELLKITAFNNYDDNCSATITNDQKTVVLGIESDFTQGGTDLYFSKKKADGTYGLLQNMGKIINSAADEGSPYLLSDQKTLLFISNGFSSYGDYDLYVSYRQDESWKNWSEPINLGSKVNSSDFEGSPFYDEKTETLYYTKWINDKPTISFVKIPINDLTRN